ncbi:unnamed protein product, partial [Brassica napus]
MIVAGSSSIWISLLSLSVDYFSSCFSVPSASSLCSWPTLDYLIYLAPCFSTC